MNIIKELISRYPQLLIPIAPNAKNSLEYRNAVLRGKQDYSEPDFIGSPEDSLASVDTPVGAVDVLYLENREDFVHTLRALAYRCEPVDIPASVGANTVSGLINWQKIREHEREYLLAGGTDPSAEFKRFTSDKKNYLDTIIILSRGDYSALPASAVGLSENEWKEKSLLIRKHHELTHFVCRKLYPGNIDAVRDEVIADMVGLFAAFGHYDPELAMQFLGIEGDCFRSGGRLDHYVASDKLSASMTAAKALIASLACETVKQQSIFDAMLYILQKYYGEIRT